MGLLRKLLVIRAVGNYVRLTGLRADEITGFLRFHLVGEEGLRMNLVGGGVAYCEQLHDESPLLDRRQNIFDLRLLGKAVSFHGLQLLGLLVVDVEQVGTELVSVLPLHGDAIVGLAVDCYFLDLYAVVFEPPGEFVG